jgi:anti-sigma factor RsiW
MTCTDAQPLISRLLDGELPDADAAAVCSHLSGCPACRQFMRDTVRIQAAVRQLADRPGEAQPVQSSIPARLRPPQWVSYVAVAAAAVVFMIIGALGTLAVTRTQRANELIEPAKVVWVLPEREITPSSIQTQWR